MIKKTKSSLRILGTALLLAGLSGCCSVFWHAGCPPNIVTQPQSQLVKKGDSVIFSVVTSPSTNVFYQWQFNGIDIATATSSSYNIASVDLTKVGEYRVKVWGSPTNISEAAYLSMYELSGAGNGGTLTTPIGNFSSQSYTCGTGTFQKGYSPVNGSGQLVFFYGPNATPQSGPFLNQSTPPLFKLTVDTFNAANGTADTGIRLRNNWSPFTVAGCNDDANPPGQAGETDNHQSQSEITLSSNGGTTQNSYRLTIFYKVPPGAPASGTVTFNWLYHN